MIIDKTTAILSLKPGASFSVYENDRIEWNSSDITQPTDDEINAEVTRLQNAEPIRQLRIERDKRIAKTDWRASVDLTLSNDWKAYRQDLRDLPAQQTPKLLSNGQLDPTSISWPPEPSS